MCFAGFFHKYINTLLSKVSLHIMPIAGHFNEFQIFCPLFIMLLFHVLYEIIGSKQCENLLVD
jgi:hypothetical protein